MAVANVLSVSIAALLGILSFANGPVLAQVCKTSNIIPSAPDTRYIDNGDGTVVDVSTGLIWQTCSYGQRYVDGKCEGYPSPTSWKEALAVARQMGDGWRVPSTKELESLVERQCLDPSINERLFPGTPSGVYLTSTPGLSPTSVRIIDFRNGLEVVPHVSPLRYVRFVKDAGDLQTDLY